ncbi:FxDxF family PEP-CTERM protein [Methylophilus sp.]|jgi:opacity protein-like surface antigen|uniref:FxDxF family PEP-CTERM protein n=1 Tax=Methylophilus sp. TaxID=29541 RepID=UPI0011DA242A|nr:FxDxF family PEP-CTERM protein [Methylophilus sp.]TXI46563.1 MAG: PEP-CTERM sorting domain-containing protein [Methylophilus sp.]
MLKNLLIAASLLASTSAFATSTTTTFNGTDLSGSSDARTAKISISSAFDFDLTGVLDPSLRLLQDNNSGLYQGITVISDSDHTFTYAPIVFPLNQFDLTRYTFSLSNLAAGSYTLQFNLIGGGHYEGSYTISSITAPVPEPETYGMMFAGLALMATIAVRRQKKN